jgi:ATP-dependent DNA helicase RecG
VSAVTSGCLFYPLGSQSPLVRQDLDRTRTFKGTLDPSLLQKPVSSLRGVGRATERRLRGLGIVTVGDLLLHLPFRHELPARLVQIAGLCLGAEMTLRGQVVSCATRETARRRVKVLEALVSDESGSVVALWYNQSYLEAPFRERPEVLLRGVLVRQRGTPVFMVKRHEILGASEESQHILGLIPVYPSTADLSVRTIRTLLHEAAPLAVNLLDPLPAEMLARRRYPGKAEAVLASHFPADLAEAEKARERMAFEELLLLQLAILQRRRAQDVNEHARALDVPAELSRAFLASLPYFPPAPNSE